MWRPWGPGHGFAFAEEMGGLTTAAYGAVVVGRRVRSPLPTVRYGAFTQGALGDALAEPAGLLVASLRLRALLDAESRARIQYLPVRLQGLRKAFALANILESVDCFDRERSRFVEEPDTGGIWRLKKLVLKGVPEVGPEVFHLRGVDGVLVFKRRLRELVENRCPSAGWFVPVSEFKIGYL